MNRLRALPLLFAAVIAVVPVTQASENETIFLPASGRLAIPHLQLGNDIYYVILNRTSPTAYNFNLDTASVTKITPMPNDDWAAPSEIVGDWGATEMPGMTLGIFGSGSYSMTTPAEDGCPAGTEVGTWTLDESTGVFFAVAATDTNGECGLSPPDGPVRLKRVGNNLEATVHDTNDGVAQPFTVTLTPQ